jgi:DNA polymerase
MTDDKSRTAAPWVPAGAGLEGLRAAARECRGCELYENATQTVFSAGSAAARVAFVGEQPGDQEDRTGEPFVGPAGRLLDKALLDAGIDRSDAYVTNAVKHFRFTQEGPGKRRIHATPGANHIDACKPWLVAELAVVDPEVVVCLGATAARALLGPTFRVSKQRGTLVPRLVRDPGESAAVQNGWLTATVHPSAVLRASDRDSAYAGFVADLRVVADVLQ